MSFLHRLLAGTLVRRVIETDKQIDSYIHCPLCMDSRPQDESSEDWARLVVGWTSIGLQVFCQRHRINVLHLDFLDHRLPVAGPGDVEAVHLSPRPADDFTGT